MSGQHVKWEWWMCWIKSNFRKGTKSLVHHSLESVTVFQQQFQPLYAALWCWSWNCANYFSPNPLSTGFLLRMASEGILQWRQNEAKSIVEAIWKCEEEKKDCLPVFHFFSILPLYLQTVLYPSFLPHSQHQLLQALSRPHSSQQHDLGS